MKNKITFAIFSLVLAIGSLIWFNQINIQADNSYDEFTFELLGPETIYLSLYSDYVEPGYIAYDPVLGDIRSNVEISNNVNNTTAGTYYIYYYLTNNGTRYTKTRTIIVSTLVETGTIVINADMYYDYSNTIINAIATSDDGILYLGRAYESLDIYGSNKWPFVAKYDKNNNFEWISYFPYSNYYAYDAVEEEDCFKVIINNGSYTQFYEISKDGSTINYLYQINSSLRKLYKYNDRYYFVPNSSYSYYLYYGDESGYNYLYQSNAIASSSYKNIFFYDNKFYYKDYNYGYLRSFDLETNSLSGNLLSEYSVGPNYTISDNNYIYVYDTYNYLRKFDMNLNLIKSVHFGSQLDYMTIEDNKIVLYFNNSKNLKFIDKDSLNVDYNLTCNIQNMYTLNSYKYLNNKFLYLGTSNSYDPYVSYNDFSCLEPYVYDLNYELTMDDHKNHIDIKEEDDKLYLDENNIYLNDFDSSKAGNYKINYIYEKKNDDSVKHIMVSKNIIINHKTSLVDGATYEGGIELDVEGASILIDGEEYFYGDYYSKIGSSTVIVKGANDYEKSYNIFIEPTVDGVTDGGIYYSPVTPEFSCGSALLNGEMFESGTQISNVGNYELLFNNYVITNNSATPFQINGNIYTSMNHNHSSSSEITFTFNRNMVFKFDYTVSSERNCDMFYIKINGLDYDSYSGSYSNVPDEIEVNSGDYITFSYVKDSSVSNGTDNVIIEVYDPEIVKSVEFTIEPYINVTEGFTYKGSVTPVIENCELLLNGEEYESGVEITTPGIYTLVIKGEGDYEKEINFTVELVYNGIENERTYEGVVSPYISAENVLLDGELYISKTEISMPGLHKLEIETLDDKVIIEFRIEPIISGVENGKVYEEIITPNISGGRLLLNGVPYSGTPISMPNNYELVIIGFDGYNKKINFTINDWTNIINNYTYINSVQIDFLGNALLNDESITSGKILNEVGKYTLVIESELTTNSFEFIIEPDYSQISNIMYGEFSFKYENAEVKIDGENYDSGSHYKTYGQHKLVVTGKNGYEKEIEFTLYPKTNIKDGDIFYEPVMFNFGEEEIAENAKIDGVPYTEPILVDQIGNHKLELEVNGVSYVYNYTINPIIKNVEDGILYFDPLTIEIKMDKLILPEGQNITLNGEDLGPGEINKSGFYVLEIPGVGGYNQTINFWYLGEEIFIQNNTDDVHTIFEKFIIDDCDFDILVDENEYVQGTEFKEYGLHVIEFKKGENSISFDFKLLPQYEIIDNKDGTFKIESDYDQIYVNNEIHNSTIIYSEVGNYEVLIRCASGFEHKDTFVIKEIIKGLEGVLKGNVSIDIDNLDNCIKAEIDGNEVTSTYDVSTVGHHFIKVYGINGYVSFKEFTIVENIVGVSDKQISFAPIPLEVNVNDCISVKLNGEIFTGSETISKVGKHTLQISGTNGYENEITFTIHETMMNITENMVVVGSITPIIENCDLLLDGQSYTSGTIIEEIGNHKLTINGEGGYSRDIHFTIKEEFSLNEEYNESFVITLENCTLELNGATFNSGDSVANIGEYTLTIKGKGNYESTYNFTIIPNVVINVDGENYQLDSDVYIGNSIWLRISGAGIDDICLNDETYIFGSMISNVGIYNLVINGQNGYVYEYQFVKGIDLGEWPEDNIFESFEINFTQCEDLIYYVNGESVNYATSFNQVGKYTLEIYFDETVLAIKKDFVIEEYVIGVENEQVYTSSVTPVIENTELLLNGEPYISGTTIKEVGSYELIIQGINGYSKSIKFEIEPIVPEFLVDNYETEEALIIEIDNCTLYLNDEPYESGTKISDFGIYYLKIYGINTNNENVIIDEINFVIKPVIEGIENDKLYFEGISAFINGSQSIELDDEDYYSGNPIYGIGKHKLTIYGVNDYVEELSFIILPKLKDLVLEEDNKIKVNLDFDETVLSYINVKVNNELISETMNYSVFGNYVVDIKLKTEENCSEEMIEYYQYESATYTIYPKIILKSISQVEKPDLVDSDIINLGYYNNIVRIEIVNSPNNMSFDIKYCSNPNEVINVTLSSRIAFVEIKKAGRYEFTLENEGLKITYCFYIEPLTIKLDDFYYNSFTIDKDNVIYQLLNEGYKVWIDGEEFKLKDEEEPNKKELLLEEKYTIDKIGKHLIKIEGINGFVKEIEFLIKFDDKNIYNEETKEFTIPSNVSYVKLNGQIVLLNLETNNYIFKLNGIGKNVIEIGGINYNNPAKPYIQKIEYFVEYDENMYPYTIDENQVITFKNQEYLYDKVIIDDEFIFTFNDFYKLKEFALVGHHSIKLIGLGMDDNPSVESKEFTIEYGKTDIESRNNILAINNTKIVFNDYNLFKEIRIDGEVVNFDELCHEYSFLGTHTLKLIGYNGYEVEEYEFNIYHETDGRIYGNDENNDQVFEKGIMNVDFSKVATKVWLDGTLIEKNSLTGEYRVLTYDLGIHTIKIEAEYKDGRDPFIYEYNVIIKPDVESIVKPMVGKYIVNIPNAFLIMVDGKQVTNGSEIKEIGYHSLEIYGYDYRNKRVYKFEGLDNLRITVVEDFNLVKDDPENNVLKSTIYMIPIINANFEIDGIAYAGGQRISEAGLHTITVIGTNGYTSTYKFTIDVIPSYDNNILKSNGGTIKVNGKVVPQGYKLNTVGVNTVEFIGAGGAPVKTVYIEVVNKLNIGNNGTYRNKLLVPKIDGTVLIDGVEIQEDTLIQRHGKHVITVVGPNGAIVEEIHIRIQNVNSIIAYVATFAVGLCVIGFGIVLIRRKRVL